LLDSTEKDEDIKSPQFALGFSFSIPTGDADEKYDLGVVPGKYQLGSGVFGAAASASYSQQFGGFSAMAAMSYSFPGAVNDVGYEKSDSVSWLLGAKYRAVEDVKLDVFSSFLVTNPLMPDQMLGAAVSGTGARSTFIDAGFSFEPADKILVGCSVKIPVEDPNNTSGWELALGMSYRF
jgi:hypothetical protein